MAQIIYGSICLTDIPKELIKVVTRKDGSTGKYLSIAVIEKKEPKTFSSNSGKTRTFTHFLTCAPKKEEQVQGVNYILGDLETYSSQPQHTQEPVTVEDVNNAPAADESDDEPLPF